MRKPASSLAKVDYSSAYLEQTHAFGELIRNVDQSTPVPTCPGWSLGQLFRHVGRGDRWAAQIVRDRLDHFLDPRSVEGGKPPPDPDDAISWLYGGARLLVDAVEQTGVETPVWTFLGPRPAGWWVRRRLHEVAVHRADVAITVGGEFTLEPNVAADGISEFLERIAVQAGSGGTPLPLEDDEPYICTPPIRGFLKPANGRFVATSAASPGRIGTERVPWHCVAAPPSCCWRWCADSRLPTPASSCWGMPGYGKNGWIARRCSRRTR